MIERYLSGTAAAALLASAVSLAAPVLAQTDQAVGTVGAANPVSRGTPPGQAQRVVELGTQVIHRERIVTTDAGSLQLAFLDKSTLSIGPNSDIVIDEYVYDPNAGQGRMALTLTRGALRFVGGKISHGGGAEVKTPVATIGIRGGAGTFSHDAGDAPGTQIVTDYGRFFVQTSQGSVEIRRPGFVVTVGADGTPSQPVRVAQAHIDAATRRLSSLPGQTGGAPNMPTDEIAGSLIGAETAEIAPSDVTPLAGSLSDTTGPSTTLSTAMLAAQGTGGLLQDATAQRAVNAIRPTDPPPVDPQYTAGVFGYYMPGGSGMSGVSNSRIFPYVSGQMSGPPGQALMSPFVGYRLGGTGDDAARIRGLQVGFRLDGEGSAQSSSLIAAVGDLTLDADGHYQFNGSFTASTRTAARNGPAFAYGSFTSIPQTIQAGADGLPTSFGFKSTAATQYGGGVTSTRYSFTQGAVQIPIPAGIGENRVTRTMTGYTAGTMATTNYTSNTLGATSVGAQFYTVSGTVAVTVDPAAQRVAADVSVGTDAGTDFQAGVFKFGNTGPNQVPTGVAVDTETYAALTRNGRSSPASTYTVNGVTAVYRSADQLFTNWKTLTAAAPELRNGIQGVTFCDCTYSDWGIWSGNGYRDTGATTHSEERVHAMPWVAGVVTTDMPVTGSASYSGQVVGTVYASPTTATSYISGGQFAATMDFAKQRGTFDMNFDNLNFTGSMRGTAGTPNFTGQVAQGSSGNVGALGVSGVISGGIAGSFYGPGAAEMGGRFELHGNNYMAGGIFLGRTGAGDRLRP